MKMLEIFWLGLCIVLGLYFGIGGIVNIQSNSINSDKQILGLNETNSSPTSTDTSSVIYDGITFKNKKALSAYLNSS
jgi:hypothetical protein